MSTFDPSERDELVSAYLDGEATPDERALVEGSPELLAEVETLRAVLEMVAEPVAPPADDVRERHIAAALAASSTAANVTSLAAPAATARASRKRRFDQRILVSAAAVVAVIAIAIPVLRSANSDSDDSSAGAVATSDEAVDTAELDGALQGGDDSDDGAGDDAAMDMDMDEGSMDEDEGAMDDDEGEGAMAEAEAAAPAATPPASDDEDAMADDEGDSSEAAEDEAAADDADDGFAARMVVELPTTADEEAFAAAITELFEGATEPELVDTPFERSCAEAFDEAVTDSDIVTEGRSTIGERPVEFVIYALASDGEPFVTAIDPTDCSVVFEDAIQPS